MNNTLNVNVVKYQSLYYRNWCICVFTVQVYINLHVYIRADRYIGLSQVNLLNPETLFKDITITIQYSAFSWLWKLLESFF